MTLRKQQVLKKYDVTLIDDATGDESAAAEENTPKLIHLRLTPHVARRGEFTQLDLWYDTQTLLPVRVATLDETENRTTVILSNVKVDQPVTDKVFDTTPPAASEGWTVEIKPWQTAE